MSEATKILKGPTRPSPSPANHGSCLVHIYPSGPALGTRFPVNDQIVTLGRDEGCDICVREESVSRKHAFIHPGPSACTVTDLNSTNGTFVNDVRVRGECPLKDGDYLRVGNTIYRFLSGGNVEAQYHEEIYRLVIIDALTEVHNKRYFLEDLNRTLATATRYNRPLSLLMIDVDRFKAINDQLGHLGGDATLRELAHCLKQVIRKDDLLARYGGEEFALVLPETPHAEGMEVAERLRRLIAEHPFRYEDKPCSVTISLGVAATEGKDWITTGELIEEADARLYEAKRQGRNRVVG